jgi:cytochrome c peroxidase
MSIRLNPGSSSHRQENHMIQSRLLARGLAACAAAPMVVIACSTSSDQASTSHTQSLGVVHEAPPTSGEPSGRARAREGRPSSAGAPAHAIGYDRQIETYAQRMIDEGREIFRHDTFGSEDFWGGKVRLHEAIAGEKLGGVGAGVSPKAALALGLKVDAEAIPAELAAKIKAGQVDMDDPATTAELLKLNAVVGVKAVFDRDGSIQSMGINCALCHSTVDDSFSPGIGNRLDGWANRDLNIGAIVASAPNLQPFSDLLGVDVPTVKEVLNSWGPGRYDAELNMDGRAKRPDGKTAATLIPSAFGLAGVNHHTWTGGWGTATYWNAYVANTQMYGKGTFIDPRLDNASQYPVAAKAGFGHKRDEVDMITAKLPALHFYQLAMPAPRAPEGSYDSARAARGERLFNDSNGANCARCHVPPLFTEPGHNLHTAREIGIDDFQASRGPDRSYVTTPLRALFDTQKIHKGGFYHDGRFATLEEVVNHYNRHFKLDLSEDERSDLIEYLKSI